ncbi:hypothetical protein ADUPG1_006673, partial [Aduncisulcus paluster]
MAEFEESITKSPFFTSWKVIRKSIRHLLSKKDKEGFHTLLSMPGGSAGWFMFGKYHHSKNTAHAQLCYKSCILLNPCHISAVEMLAQLSHEPINRSLFSHVSQWIQEVECIKIPTSAVHFDVVPQKSEEPETTQKIEPVSSLPVSGQPRSQAPIISQHSPQTFSQNTQSISPKQSTLSPTLSSSSTSHHSFSSSSSSSSFLHPSSTHPCEPPPIKLRSRRQGRRRTMGRGRDSHSGHQDSHSAGQQNRRRSVSASVLGSPVKKLDFGSSMLDSSDSFPRAASSSSSACAASSSSFGPSSSSSSSSMGIISPATGQRSRPMRIAKHGAQGQSVVPASSTLKREQNPSPTFSVSPFAASFSSSAIENVSAVQVDFVTPTMMDFVTPTITSLTGSILDSSKTHPASGISSFKKHDHPKGKQEKGGNQRNERERRERIERKKVMKDDSSFSSQTIPLSCSNKKSVKINAIPQSATHQHSHYSYTIPSSSPALTNALVLIVNSHTTLLRHLLAHSPLPKLLDAFFAGNETKCPGNGTNNESFFHNPPPGVLILLSRALLASSLPGTAAQVMIYLKGILMKCPHRILGLKYLAQALWIRREVSALCVLCERMAVVSGLTGREGWQGTDLAREQVGDVGYQSLGIIGDAIERGMSGIGGAGGSGSGLSQNPG